MTRLRRELVRWRTLAITLFLAVILLGIFYARSNNKTQPLPSLAVHQVQVRNVERRVSVDGNIASNNQKDVSISAGYKVTKLNFNLGDDVAEGAKLARVELNKVGADILSPIAGKILRMDVVVNEVISTPRIAFTIADVNDLVVSALVNENDISELAISQGANIVLPAISVDAKINGTVEKISLLPESATGAVNYKVALRPGPLPANSKIGMSADVSILTAKVDNVLAIPENFLIEKDDKFFVKEIKWKDEMKLEYETVEVEVKLGLRTDEYVEIKSGISAGDELLEPAFTTQRQTSLFGR